MWICKGKIHWFNFDVVGCPGLLVKVNGTSNVHAEFTTECFEASRPQSSCYKAQPSDLEPANLSQVDTKLSRVIWSQPTSAELLQSSAE